MADSGEIDDMQQSGGGEPLLPEGPAVLMVFEEHPGGYEKRGTPPPCFKKSMAR